MQALPSLAMIVYQALFPILNCDSRSRALSMILLRTFSCYADAPRGVQIELRTSSYR
jgi:hypothetical protein